LARLGTLMRRQFETVPAAGDTADPQERTPEERPDGSVVVSAQHVERLGDGVVDRGMGVLDRIIRDIRGRRVA
jgi:hypothetical protein